MSRQQLCLLQERTCTQHEGLYSFARRPLCLLLFNQVICHREHAIILTTCCALHACSY